MNKINAPEYGGTWTWSGELTPETEITLANGKKVLYSRIIAMTNGEVLEWFDENMSQVEKESE